MGAHHNISTARQILIVYFWGCTTPSRSFSLFPTYRSYSGGLPSYINIYLIYEVYFVTHFNVIYIYILFF